MSEGHVPDKGSSDAVVALAVGATTAIVLIGTGALMIGLTLFFLGLSVILAMVPGYGLLWLWNHHAADMLGAHRITSTWHVFGIIGCISVINGLIGWLTRATPAKG